MNKIIKEYKGAILFYILLIISIFIISMSNANFNKQNSSINNSKTQVALNN